MGLVTALEQQKKDKKRYNVFLDRSFAFGISGELAYLNKLKVGQELSEKEIQTLIQKDQVERLVNKMLNFLGLRPRSKKEVRDHFVYKGKLKDLSSEEEKQNYLNSIERAIAKLEKLNYLNDLEFANWWVGQREEFKKSSKRIIQMELIQKGIDKEIITQILSNTKPEYEKALAASSKKAKQLSKLSKEEFKLKLGQFLARRGFDWDTVKKVVDSYLEKS